MAGANAQAGQGPDPIAGEGLRRGRWLRPLLATLPLCLAGLLAIALAASLLRWWMLPAPGPGQGLLGQRHADARLGGEPAPPRVETRTAMSDRDDADFRGEDFSLRLTGVLRVALPGPYQLGVESDDDSRLYIDGHKVVDNSGEHPPRLRWAWVWLGPGPHLIEVENAQRAAGAGLRLVWRPFHRLGQGTMPVKVLAPTAAPLGRAAAQALGDRLDSAHTPFIGLALWGVMVLAARAWLPRFGQHGLLAAASLVMAILMWLSSGTMAVYGATTPQASLWGPCRYVVNIDNMHFEATYWMLSGDPLSKWGFSLVLRRILYPLVALPFMLARGFLEGGFLANLFLHVLAIHTWALYLGRRVGQRGAAWGVWLLATYPGICYWAGLPYSYAIIVPACLWGFMLLDTLARTERPGRVALCAAGLGVLALGYDLLPFFAPAALGLVLWRSRRPLLALLALAGLAAPLALLLLVMDALGVPPASQNAAQPLGILLSYFQASDYAAWGRLLAKLPGVLVNNFLASNFYVLPLMFLALLVPNLRRGGHGLWPAEVALLLGLLAVFLFNNLAPPHGFGTFRGEFVPRFYQPAFVVWMLYAARLAQDRGGGGAGAAGGRRTYVLGVLVLALTLNAAICLGPALGLSLSSQVYWRFYRHAPDGEFMNRALTVYGRRPLGCCSPADPARP